MQDHGDPFIAGAERIHAAKLVYFLMRESPATAFATTGPFFAMKTA